jgi:hypothetical protein
VRAFWRCVMRRGAVLTALGFGVALAVIVGLRLEEAGLAVLVGVLCGIGASLPVSGVLLTMLWRERRERRLLEERQWRGENRTAAAPPVVILNAGRGAELLPPPPHSLGATGGRSFTIIGEEE